MGMTELSRRYALRSSAIDAFQVRALIETKGLPTEWIVSEILRGNLKVHIGYENAEVVTPVGTLTARPGDYVFRDADGYLGVISGKDLMLEYENIDPIACDAESHYPFEPTGIGVFVTNNDCGDVLFHADGYDCSSITESMEPEPDGRIVTTIELRKPQRDRECDTGKRPFVEVM